jgi:hypothetical protein
VVGCSSLSRLKWERLEYLLEAHATACKSIIGRKPWASKTYHYFDFYSGPGIYAATEDEDLIGEHGSPIRAIRTLERVGIDYRVLLSDEKEAHRLTRNLGTIGIDGVYASPLTCSEAVDLYTDDARWVQAYSDTGKPFGIAFFDPNGVPDWAAVERFSNCYRFRFVDLLINVNATINKRCRASSRHAETMRPTDHLLNVGKDQVVLWDPCPGDSWQFTLAYCTSRAAPTFKTRSLGFLPIDEPGGQRIARRIDFSEAERKYMPPPTGHLPGIDWS